MRRILLFLISMFSVFTYAQDYTIKTSGQNEEYISVDLPKGAYLLSVATSSDAYGAFDLKDASLKSLANDLCGNDANERKTIPMRVFTPKSTFTKRIYLCNDCTTINVINPNGVKFSLVFEKIEGSKDYDLVVAADGSGQLTDLYDAIKWIGDSRNNHKTIFVKSGIYNMPELNFNTNIYRDYRNFSIIGESRESVIIQNTNGRYYPAKYDNAPLQFSGNCTIKNVSVKSTDKDGKAKGTAYCMHADFRAHGGDVFTLENCDFYNNHYAALALCPNAGQTIRVINCTAKTEGINDVESTWQGVLISHDNNNGDGEGLGIIEILSSTLESDGNNMAITSNQNPILLRINDTDRFIYGEGKDFYTFIGNVTIDKNYQTGITNVQNNNCLVNITNSYIEISGLPENETVNIYNLAGNKVLFSKSNHDKVLVIGIANIPSGVYIIKSQSLCCKFKKKF